MIGVESVVTIPIITNIENISASIKPALYAILAITNSIIPLALSPTPSVSDIFLFKPANLPPK